MVVNYSFLRYEAVVATKVGGKTGGGGGYGAPRLSPCYGPDTVKSYASDKLAYLEEGKTKITVLQEELQSVSSKYIYSACWSGFPCTRKRR